jgi:prefoldin subunit 5
VLNEKDQVWERYKNMHIAEVLGGLTEEITILKQDQEELRKIGGQDDIHQDDIQKVLRSLPEFEKRSAEVLIHLGLA